MDDEQDMIKRRIITVELTDEECEDLSIKAGSVGLTVGELLQNFISDLTRGERSNGSDERLYADGWFQRCMFGFGEYPFLRFLLENYGCDESEYYFKTLTDIETAKKRIDEIKEGIAHPKEEWKNFVHSDGSPRFNSVEEYIENKKACLSAYEAELDYNKKEFDDLWNEYLEFIQEAQLSVSGTPDCQEEIKKFMLWYSEQQAIMECITSTAPPEPLKNSGMTEQYETIKPPVPSSGRLR